MITIRHRYGKQPEEVYNSPSREVIIGRPGGELPVTLDLSPDLRVSRNHARLFYDLNTWWVEDLVSQNGTVLNGTKITEPTALTPRDQLQVGDTMLQLEFVTVDTEIGEGIVESDFQVDEIQPPPAAQEDKLVEIFAKIFDIAERLQGQEMLDGFLREILATFPGAERGTILLIEDRELVPRAFRPEDRSRISFTLARQVIQSKRALHWVRQVAMEGEEPIAESLYDTMTAIYVPMLRNDRVIGAIHVDSASTETAFSESDLEVLSVIANVVGLHLRDATDLFRRIPTVFVSYAREDRDFVDCLAAGLRRRRVKVWFDERLKGGQAWLRQLATAIENTDAFVLVMSPPSISSSNVEWELDTAQALNKKIFPLMYQACEVPSTILALQYLNIGADYDAGLDELVEQLDELANESEEELPARAPVVPLPRPESPAAESTTYILHLSDLHFGTLDNAHNWYGQLAEDLYHELKCEHIDMLILSGDIANRATKGEYDAAEFFIRELCQEFGVDQQGIVIIPGNHDVDWVAAQRAYRSVRRADCTEELEAGSFIDRGEEVEVPEAKLYKQRFADFSAFYQAIRGETYPLEYDQQYGLFHFPDHNLLVVGLNSAWQLDHHFEARANIYPNAITNALSQIRRHGDTYGDCLKFAVWHHPLESPSEDRIKDHGFVEQLAKAGFRLALHGHIHKAVSSSYHYDQNPDGRKVDVVGAGTFGAPVRGWYPGYPLQYNLVKLTEDVLTVETRRREELNGAWKPDARWTQGAGKDPLPRYEIKL
jgi:3',5'-cyclic AMP phosphodiesterase CpdA